MALSDAVLQISKKLYSENKDNLLNIIDFAHSRSGLNITLYPGQIFIFKLFYKIPLSDDKEENCIVIKDEFNEKVLYEFSELEFLDFLYKEKRINVSREDILSGDYDFDEIIFVIGRRGSKTTMISIITAYTLYMLLNIDNPHKFFGILESDNIGVAITSNTGDSASRQFASLSKIIKESQFFKPYIYKEAGGSLFLYTKEALSKVNKNEFNETNLIEITSFAASPSVRGPSNIVVVMDEFAHFIDSDASTKANPLDKKMYEALTPSVSGFVDENGKAYGKVFIISSPNGRKGMMYNMYIKAFKHKTTLVIRVPSNWINIRVASSLLRSMYNKSVLSFRQEYRADFVDNEADWITNPNKVYCCVDKSRPNILIPPKRLYSYYMGLDFALSGDGTAIAIAHYEPRRPEQQFVIDDLASLVNPEQEAIVVDYVSYILPKEGEVLDPDKVIDEVERIAKYFKISEGLYDQWAAAFIEHLLTKKKLHTKIKKQSMTQQFNHELATTFKQLIQDGKLVLFDEGLEVFDNNGKKEIVVPEGSFIEELFSLKESVAKNGLIKVEDTTGHDDRYDAISRAVFLALKYKNTKKYSSGMNTSKQQRAGTLGMKSRRKQPLNRPFKVNRDIRRVR